MKRARLSLLQDIYFFLTFLLDTAVLTVAVSFVLRGWEIAAYDEFFFTTLYAFLFGALNLAAFALYYSLAFAFAELHLCLFTLRLSFCAVFWINAAVGLYSQLTLQNRLGAVRFEFQSFWFFCFFFDALFNALLVVKLRPHFSLQAKSRESVNETGIGLV